mmetsp:Transcript_13906/g.21046  ORF Transcript_13906/g.21046 Transcript_13906/m.21046 type:complete len:319 (+) Transcript_13906:62-1018(+)
MKNLIILVILIVLLNVGVQAEEDQYKPITLTDANFEETIKNSGLWFIKYYAPWCGHCKALQPVWDELAERIHKMNENMINEKDQLFIASVDCTKNKETCKKAHVAGYPTLMLYNAGKQVTEYQGKRSVQGLATFLKDMLSQQKSEGHIIEMTPAIYSRDSLRINSKWLVHMYNDASGIVGLQHTLNELAKKYQETTAFISQLNCDTNEEICKRYGITERGQNKIYLFAGNQLKAYTGDALEATLDELSQFIDEGMTGEVTHRPVLEQDNSAFYQMVLAIIVGIVVMFVVLCTIVVCFLDEKQEDEYISSDDELLKKNK